MTKYDNEYFFIRFDNDNPRAPFLSADTNTGERRFRTQPERIGSAPLIFSNGLKKDFRKRGVKDDVADILFDGSNFMVRDKIRERLLPFHIPNLHLHPSIYIDDNDKWHEDYWYLTFSQQFDCWDHKSSIHDNDPVVIGQTNLYDVYKYSLNSTLLDNTPLKNRLLFKLGSTLEGMVVCHASIAGMFRGGGKSGALVQAITDY